MTKTIIITAALIVSCSAASVSAQKPKPTRKVTYKTVGDVKLTLHLFEPKGHKSGANRPAIVFFFGGGWVGGRPAQFYPHCEYLASRGMVAAAAEYRVRSKHKTKPYECVKDGKSAVRYMRKNAKALGIDPKRLAAGGGSAGGHVAAAVATVKGFNETGEDTSISCVPNALVLFNPVYDNGPKGYGHSRVKEHWKEFSPMHNIRKGIPPAIVFLGTKDKLIPVATGEAFRDKMKSVGARSELFLYRGQPHGFFNKGRNKDVFYVKTVTEMDRFLNSLGWIQGEPTVKKP